MQNSRLNKNIFNTLLFLCISIPYLNVFEMTIATWGLTALTFLTTRYSKEAFKITSVYVIIFLIGIFVSYNKNYGFYNVFRDATYFIKPILGILIGYNFVKHYRYNAFKSIIYAAAIIGAIHLIVIAILMITTQKISINDIRQAAGFFSDFEVYALIILIFHAKFGVNIPRLRYYYLLAVIGISAFMYLSRTNFIQFIVLYLGIKGYYRLTSRSVIILSTFILAAIVGYVAILYMNPSRSGPGLEAFLYKIKIAPIEPFKTKINVENWKDYNDNYRSYENIRVIEEVTNYGFESIMFGRGFGSKIDLIYPIVLDGEEARYIPIVHNGFMTVFLKTGLLGVILLLYSIYLLLRIKTVNNSNTRLLFATGLFLFISYWVFLGLYFTADTKSIIIGILIAAGLPGYDRGYNNNQFRNQAKAL